MQLEKSKRMLSNMGIALTCELWSFGDVNLGFYHGFLNISWVCTATKSANIAKLVAETIVMASSHALTRIGGQ